MTLGQAAGSFDAALAKTMADREKAGKPAPAAAEPGVEGLDHGAVVIASITSCTNTSNPSVMIGAGLLAKKAVERGLRVKPWVKTSLAPGSKAVTQYLDQAGLSEYLDRLGFQLVGYGCATCIGNSGPLPSEVAADVKARDLVVASVLSGNRNFEGRIQQQVRANYLASPPLVVAYALAGTMRIDLTSQPLGKDPSGTDVYLKDVWPSAKEIEAAMLGAVTAECFSSRVRRTCSAAISGGRLFRCRRATASCGTRSRPTSAIRRSSMGCRPRPRRRPTSEAPACWRCSATA